VEEKRASIGMTEIIYRKGEKRSIFKSHQRRKKESETPAKLKEEGN